MTATIRHARAIDVHEIERLVRSDPAAAFDAGELYGHGHLIVLDVGNGRLGGVAHLDLVEHRPAALAGRCDRARLDVLVVDEACMQADEDRLRDVAHALGEAYGCSHVETVPIDRASLPPSEHLERGMHANDLAGYRVQQIAIRALAGNEDRERVHAELRAACLTCHPSIGERRRRSLAVFEAERFEPSP